MGFSFEGSGGGNRGPWVPYSPDIPTKAMVHANIVDFVYSGERTNRFNQKTQLVALLVLQLETRGKDGKRILAGRDITLSSHEKANLSAIIEAAGATFAVKQHESAEAGVEYVRGLLLGKPVLCLFKEGSTIEKGDNKGKKYINLAQVLPAINKDLKADDYDRARDLKGGKRVDGDEGGGGDDIPI